MHTCSTHAWADQLFPCRYCYPDLSSWAEAIAEVNNKFGEKSGRIVISDPELIRTLSSSSTNEQFVDNLKAAFNAAREEVFVDRFGKWKYPTFEDYLNSKNK